MAKKKRDFSQVAHSIVERLTKGKLTGGELPEPGKQPEKPDTRNPHAVALSKLGASKGGKARAESLGPTRRSEIARNAARKRWRKGRAQ